LQIKKDSKIIIPNKCEDIFIESGKTYKLDLSREFEKFSEI